MSLLPRIIPASSLKMKILVGPRYHLMLCRPSHCGDFRTQGSKISVPSSACFSLLNHGSPLPETNIHTLSGDSCEIESAIEPLNIDCVRTERNQRVNYSIARFPMCAIVLESLCNPISRKYDDLYVQREITRNRVITAIFRIVRYK